MSETDREKWDAKYKTGAHGDARPSPFLVSCTDLLPKEGTVLDVAGGAGGNAVWAAQHGLSVTVVDISEAGLAQAQRHAERAGVSIETVCTDLESNSLPGADWDVIMVFSFLLRPLFPKMAAALKPSGLLIVCHPTRTNLQRNDKPGERFLLDDGELPLLAKSLEVLCFTECWSDENCYEARGVFRRFARG